MRQETSRGLAPLAAGSFNHLTAFVLPNPPLQKGGEGGFSEQPGQRKRESDEPGTDG